MRGLIAIAILAGWVVLLGSAQGWAITYNAVNDFSLSSNPNGQWSYLYDTGSGPQLLPYAQANAVGVMGLNQWWNGEATPNSLSVWQNASGGTVSYLSIVDPPNLLWLDPQSHTVIVRWTAPLSGTWDVTGLFQGINGGEQPHNVEILENYSTVLLAPTTMSSYGQVVPFNQPVSLIAGNTIDFMVAATGGYHNLSTGLSASIAPLTATITLLGTVNERIMTGGTATLGTTVSNAAPIGGADLNYTLAANVQSGSATLGAIVAGTGSLAPSASQSCTLSVTSTNLGVNTISFTASDPNASNSPQTTTATLTVVNNRVVTSTAVGFGVVHVGASLHQGITLSTIGGDSYFTRVTVTNGGTDSNGFFTVSGGSKPTFNSALVTDNRTIAGTANMPGVFNGTVTLTTSGEGLAGESPINVPVNYSVQVFSGQAGWIGGSIGSWGNGANWQDLVTPSISAAPGIWGVLGDTAALGSGPSGPVTITLDGTSPHLGSLTLSSSAGYTLVSVVDTVTTRVFNDQEFKNGVLGTP